MTGEGVCVCGRGFPGWGLFSGEEGGSKLHALHVTGVVLCLGWQHACISSCSFFGLVAVLQQSL